MSVDEAADALLSLASDPGMVEVDRDTAEAARYAVETLAALAASERIDADVEPIVDVVIALEKAIDDQGEA